MRITKQTYLDVWREIPVKASMAIAEIHSMKTPEISTINRGEKSTEPAIILYEFVIIGLLEFFGVEWSKEQIRECAELLFNEYYWLHIAELKHLITKVKTGEIEMADGKKFKTYGKFNPQLLMECFSQYADESLKERQQAYERQAGDERYNERWGSRDERLKSDSEAWGMNGLVEQEKSKLKNDGKTNNVD